MDVITDEKMEKRSLPSSRILLKKGSRPDVEVARPVARISATGLRGVYEGTGVEREATGPDSLRQSTGFWQVSRRRHTK